MTARSSGQNRSLDVALAQGGFDALHPGGKATLEQLGHDTGDFDKGLRPGSERRDAAESVVGDRRPGRGAGPPPRNPRLSAHRIGPLRPRRGDLRPGAVFDLLNADARKAALRSRCDHCVDRLAQLRGNIVRRVELDFEGSSIFGLLHLPPGDVIGAPAVILGPGMDMDMDMIKHGPSKPTPPMWPGCRRSTPPESACSASA